MLDIDQGTYPFVTSSNPVAGGVTIGSGVGPSKINKVVGVCKAYTSRVGDGPFPTELLDEVGDRIREVGHEYGTTTGRPRRVGWFDSVVMRHSRRVSGITNLSLNSIDVLSGLDTVKICVPTTWMGNASTTTQQAWSNSNVANQSMKNYQVGQKTSQVAVALTNFQKMLVTTFVVLVNLLVFAFQHSQLDRTATKRIFLSLFGQIFKKKTLIGKI